MRPHARSGDVDSHSAIIASYVIALVMMLSQSLLHWILQLFSAWVFVTSLFILNSEIRAFRATGSVAGDAPPGEVL